MLFVVAESGGGVRFFTGGDLKWCFSWLCLDV